MLRAASFLFCVAFAFGLASACQGSQEPDVEVLVADPLAVLVSESNGALVGVLDEQRVLAGEQFVLLPGRGADEPASRLVALQLRPGPHQIDLEDDDEPVVVVFEAVSEDEIVQIELVRPDEAELRPGTWVEVDVVGVTESGAQVRSVHPRFESPVGAHLGYFAYQFDPDAEPQTLKVAALDFELHTYFRGLIRRP